MEVLEACRPSLEAEDRLAEAYAGKIQLTSDQWYDLTLAATGDKERADAVSRAYMAAMLRAGHTPR